MAKPRHNMPTVQGSFDGEVIKQSDFEKYVPNKFRVLGIVIPFAAVYYPAWVKDKDTQELRLGKKMLRLPLKCDDYGWEKQPTILDDINKLDVAIQTKHRPVGSSGKIHPELKPTFRYLLPCFHRGGDKPNEIVLLQIGKQIYDAIKALQKQPDEDDVSKLSHGPIWVSDIVITKEDKEEKTGNEFFDIVYRTRSGRDNPFAGKFSKDVYLSSNSHVLDKLYDESVKHGVFTEEEKKAFDEWAEEPILTRYAPMSPEEIMQSFVENKLVVDAVDGKQKPLFVHHEEFMEGLHEIAIECASKDLKRLDSPEKAGKSTPPESQAKLASPGKAEKSTTPEKLDPKNDVTNVTKEKVEEEDETLDFLKDV